MKKKTLNAIDAVFESIDGFWVVVTESMSHSQGKRALYSHLQSMEK